MRPTLVPGSVVLEFLSEGDPLAKKRRLILSKSNSISSQTVYKVYTF